MISIRNFDSSDSLTELTELLHRAYARLGSMGLNFTAVDQSPEVTAERIAEGHCFVAEWFEKLAGTIVVKPTDANDGCEYFRKDGVATVHQFGVEPAMQRKGIGRALLSRCEQWATEHGYSEVALDTSEKAHHLIELYSTLGYKPVGYVHWPGKVYRSVVLAKALG